MTTHTPAEPKYSDADADVAKVISDTLNLPWQDAMRAAVALASRPSTPDKAGVSDEDVHGAIEAYVLSHDNVSVPRFESMRAALTHFASTSTVAVRDAERYRWLRDKANGAKRSAPMVAANPLDPDWSELIHGERLDQAIDAAMQEQSHD